MDEKMKLFLITLVFAVSGFANEGYKYCKVTYPHYWDLAVTETSVKEVSKEFMYMGFDEELNCKMYSHYKDPRVILLYDDHGYLAGVRVCFVKKNIDQQAKWNKKNFEYYYDQVPSFSSRNYWGVDVWCKELLFESPKILKFGGRKSLEWTNIWVKLDKNEFVSIPTDECHVEALGFTKQNCYLGMGRHYFHNMVPWLNCSDYSGVVTHYSFGKLCGVAFAIPGYSGHFSSPSGRQWFENATKDIVEELVFTGPKCWYDNSYNFGLQDIHFMFVKEPLTMQCIWPWQMEDQCKYRSDHILKYNV